MSMNHDGVPRSGASAERRKLPSPTRSMRRSTETPLREGGRAFTLIELLVVLAVIGLFALMLASGLARTQPDVRAAQCLSNKRQVALACVMYTHEWNDYLVPNAPAGDFRGWCNGQENWTTAGANTNTDYYTSNCLARYVLNQVGVYKCPCDTKPSDNGQRIRSISMNGMMVGAIPTPGSGGDSYNPGWRVYKKTGDLTTPSPAMAWVLCDENMYSLNDGYLQMFLLAYDYPDVPAAYHNGNGNCFTFADGHAEARKWVWPGTYYAGLRSCPYTQSVSGSHWPSSGLDVDWLWLRARTSAPQ
jgi:prepilin-type N-terminal cleavage/methylation domain-containing protein